jgi:hypothetical protein
MKVLLLSMFFVLGGCTSYYTLAPNGGPIWVAGVESGTDSVLYCEVKEAEKPSPVCYPAKMAKERNENQGVKRKQSIKRKRVKLP